VDHRNQTVKIILALCFLGGVIQNASAQDNYGKYTFTPAPDVWYNSEDGVRLGIRVLGEQEGSFRDGPHRLDAGVWFGTNIPDNPISYYLNFTEPIGSISDFGEEGSFQIISSIRTGLSKHGLYLNKRWQDGFNELIYKELTLSFVQQKMFDIDYRPYPIQWSTDWRSLVGITFMTHNESEINTFEAILNVQQNVNPESEHFTALDVEAWNTYSINDNFDIGLRLFGGYTSEISASEYLFTASHAKPIDWFGNGVSRANGTIPTNWLDNGLAQVSGSANLRGYTDTQYSDLSMQGAQQVVSFNTELEFPNPLNSSLKEGLIGDFVFLKSYLFADAGTLFDDNPVLLDAGIGLQFSINIPDFLGKPRGFAIRYEVPFWISEPDAGDPNFKYRSLLGFGAVISL
jgi:hypothetical protein